MDNSCERGNATEVASQGADKPELQKVQDTNMHRKACEKGGTQNRCTATPQDAVRGTEPQPADTLGNATSGQQRL